MNLPTLLFILRCLIRDTFRQALASFTFWLMLSVSGLCILVCVSTRVDGGESLRDSESIELVKDNKPLTGPHAGLGSIGLAFGAIRLDLPRDSRAEPRLAGVHFLQTLLALWVAGTVGLLAALIWTAGFVPAFLEPGAATILLANPVPRWALLTGKYLGVLAFVGFQEAVFFGGTWLALGISTGVWSLPYLLCVPLILIQFAIIYSFAVLVGVVTRSTVASIFGSILFWFCCYAMNYGRHETMVLRLGSDGQMIEVAFHPDGQRLASASAKGAVKIWDAETGQMALSCQGHVQPVSALAFSPDGQRIASTGSDGTLHVENQSTSQETFPLRGADRPFTAGLFHPDGRFLLWQSRRSHEERGVEELVLWDAGSGQEAFRFRGHTGKINAPAFRRDGQCLATASADGSVILWDVAGRRPSMSLLAREGPLFAVAFGPSGRSLASAGAAKTVRLWDLTTGRPAFILSGHTDIVLSVTYSPDGERLASAGADNLVIVWDAATGKRRYTLASAGRYVAFSPDGRYLASVGTDNLVHLWDALSGELAQTFPRSYPDTMIEHLLEAGYWFLPKPADLLILLDQTINAGEHFDCASQLFSRGSKAGLVPARPLFASFSSLRARPAWV